MKYFYKFLIIKTLLVMVFAIVMTAGHFHLEWFSDSSENTTPDNEYHCSYEPCDNDNYNPSDPDLDALQNLVQLYRSQVGSLELKIGQIQELNQNMTAQVTQLEGVIYTLTSVIDNNGDHAEVIYDLTNQILLKQEQITSLTSQVTNLTNQVNSLNGQVTNLNNQITDLNRIINEIGTSQMFSVVFLVGEAVRMQMVVANGSQIQVPTISQLGFTGTGGLVFSSTTIPASVNNTTTSTPVNFDAPITAHIIIHVGQLWMPGGAI